MKRGPLATALLLAVAGCGPGQDAALVTVTTPSPTAPIRHLVLTVTAGARADQVTVPRGEGCPLAFPKTVSLVFPANAGDSLQVNVDGYDGSALVASGVTAARVQHGAVTAVPVALVPGAGVPVDGGASCDGGAP